MGDGAWKSPIPSADFRPPRFYGFFQSNVAGVARMGISAEVAQLASADLRVMDLQVLLATKRELRESARSCPLTLALFPNTQNVLRDREQIAGLVT